MAKSTVEWNQQSGMMKWVRGLFSPSCFHDSRCLENSKNKKGKLIWGFREHENEVWVLPGKRKTFFRIDVSRRGSFFPSASQLRKTSYPREMCKVNWGAVTTAQCPDAYAHTYAVGWPLPLIIYPAVVSLTRKKSFLIVRHTLVEKYSIMSGWQ